MKIIFLGTPELAVSTLEAICEQHEVVAVVTQPDTAVGRSKQLVPSSVAVFASSKNLPIFKPEKLTVEFTEELHSLNADLFVTFAYGKIFRESFMSIARLGGINVHPSLLPEYRGASPIQSAILDGKNSSGITIQKISLAVDSGDVLAVEKFDIAPTDDAVSIEALVSKRSPSMMLELLAKIEETGVLEGAAQNDSDAIYCKKIDKADGVIDWNSSAFDIHCKIRAFVKWPIASTVFDGKKLSIYQASVVDYNVSVDACVGEVILADKKCGIYVVCGDKTVLSLESVQIAGKNRLSAKEFLNGARDLVGKILGK